MHVVLTLVFSVMDHFRSAEYDEALKVCKLSREDRRTQPSAFRHQPDIKVDYLENQCVKRKFIVVQ